MKYFIDIDNTLCFTENSDYVNSVPIPERIAKVNELKAQGHHVTLYSSRGAVSKQDWMLFTAEQLRQWGVQYDVLSLEKPSFDVLVDDKCQNVDEFWKIPNCPPGISKVTSVQEIVPKSWGRELVIVNNEHYCSKILFFNKSYSGSLHFHLNKIETWYILSGLILLTWIQTDTGTTYSEYMKPGDVCTHYRGEPHLVEALEDTQIMETSTFHEDSDSYRIYKK
jgi:mannose-6-phosphate isomerase-like protein (cupin superfamily)